MSHFPICFAYAISGWKLSGKLTCENIDKEIIITGISAPIPELTEVGITIAIRNPTI